MVIFLKQSLQIPSIDFAKKAFHAVLFKAMLLLDIHTNIPTPTHKV